MWVIYCHLANIWVAGMTEGENPKVRYSVNREKAMHFSSQKKASEVFKHLPYVWKPHCEIMEYAKSTRTHDRYFAEQDAQYRSRGH